MRRIVLAIVIAATAAGCVAKHTKPTNPAAPPQIVAPPEGIGTSPT